MDPRWSSATLARIRPIRQIKSLTRECPGSGHYGLLTSSRSTMRDSVAEPTSGRSFTSSSRATPSPTIRQLNDWLLLHSESLTEFWLNEVLNRTSMNQGMERLLGRFLRVLVSMLPRAVGYDRAHVTPLWRRAAELYGSLGAQRGLAAGDVVEEFQILREGVIRLLFQAPLGRRDAQLSLTGVLQLNRFLDSGVTHASIGHTDALFFAMFQGSGVPKVPTNELVAEVEEQLQAVEEELRAEGH